VRVREPGGLRVAPQAAVCSVRRWISRARASAEAPARRIAA
jgi:hypothetical protein